MPVATKTISVAVKNDHLERIAAVSSPIIAIEELIWNALDADAVKVSISFSENKLSGLDGVVIKDDGHGLPYGEAFSVFSNLGGSWKRGNGKTKTKGRIVHGKAGRGRFRAFAIGQRVTWITAFKSNGSVAQYSIKGSKADLGTFHISEPETKCVASGTTVSLARIEKNFRSLRGPGAIQEITESFALYLRKYPEVVIEYDGTIIDPALVELSVTDVELPKLEFADGRSFPAFMTIIEWRTPTERALYLCDQDGFTLSHTQPGIQAPGFNFTAYLKCSLLRQLEDEGQLSLDQLHPDLKKLLDLSKNHLREHFRKRAAEAGRNIVQEWKQEKVYPFEGNANSVLEEAERQIFDVVALNMHAYLPDFERADPKSKRLALRLLKHALEDSPTAVRRILQDVLELPQAKQEEFAELLERASLTAIINAAKVVADRLDFVAGLELVLFDSEIKKKLLERTQLHRILADHTWLFGEEFNLTVDDQSLNEVLRRHLGLLGRSESITPDVQTLDGEDGVIDLMLSRLVPQPRAEQREHLVVELKRPSRPVDDEVVLQIKKYAFAVAADDRFRDTNTRWVFWAISNRLSESVAREASQSNRPNGLIYDDGKQNIQVWVKTWGQVIESSKARLTFLQEHLKYAASQDSGRAFLLKTYEKYLPPNVKAGTDDKSQS